MFDLDVWMVLMQNCAGLCLAVIASPSSIQEGLSCWYSLLCFSTEMKMVHVVLATLLSVWHER